MRDAECMELENTCKIQSDECEDCLQAKHILNQYTVIVQRLIQLGKRSMIFDEHIQST
jgi:hypothetical protein